jgi:hypothetical protein
MTLELQDNENNGEFKYLNEFEWMQLKIHLLPLLMQETDTFLEKYISK